MDVYLSSKRKRFDVQPFPLQSYHRCRYTCNSETYHYNFNLICWAQQNREIIPACILRPRDTDDLSKIVQILHKEHDRRRLAESQIEGFFSVRSGGVNPGLGASTVKDGAVVDLGLFSEITPAIDGSTVTLGPGSKWIDVYKILDEKGLIVIGGRNAPVGVGGLTLQGNIP